MVSGVFSNFEIENWILKRKVIFSSVFYTFFQKRRNITISWRFCWRNIFSWHVLWLKFNSGSLQCTRISGDFLNVDFWRILTLFRRDFFWSFFPDLCFIWQSHRFQFLGCALPIGFWQLLMNPRWDPHADVISTNIDWHIDAVSNDVIIWKGMKGMVWERPQDDTRSAQMSPFAIWKQGRTKKRHPPTDENGEKHKHLHETVIRRTFRDFSYTKMHRF